MPVNSSIVRQHAALSSDEADPSAVGLRLGKVSRVESLGDQAVAQLRGAFRRGALLPGQRLTVREIANTLQISLTPAREALNRLLAEGLLDQAPDRVAMVPRLTKARYEEICTIRLSLEAIAATEAASRLGASQCDHLRAIFEEHAESYRAADAKTSLRLNEEFHFTIYRACAMPTLLQILETLWLKIGPSLNLLFTASHDPNWTGGQHHQTMMRALAAGDAELLAGAVRQDIIDGSARLMPHLPN